VHNESADEEIARESPQGDDGIDIDRSIGPGVFGEIVSDVLQDLDECSDDGISQDGDERVERIDGSFTGEEAAESDEVHSTSTKSSAQGFTLKLHLSSSGSEAKSQTSRSATSNADSARTSNSCRCTLQSSQASGESSFDCKPSFASSATTVTELHPDSKNIQNGQDRQHFCLKELWRTSAFTDITIVCGPYNLPLHLCVLSTQCAYFKHACRHELIPTPIGDTLDMSSDDPTALSAMLKYFYLGELEVPTENLLILGGPEMPSLETLLKVYKLACKYKIPDLKAAATEQYCEVLANKWPKGHGMLLAKGLVATFAEDLEEPEVLRNAALDVAVSYGEDLFGDRVVFDLLEGEPLRALMLRLARSATVHGESSTATALEQCRVESTASPACSVRWWQAIV
jgi:hypothetical protein